MGGSGDGVGVFLKVGFFPEDGQSHVYLGDERLDLLRFLGQKLGSGRLLGNPVHSYGVKLDPAPEDVMHVFARCSCLHRARTCVGSRDLVASVKQCRTNRQVHLSLLESMDGNVRNIVKGRC